MLEISEFVLKQGYKIVTTKVKGTNKFKGLCMREDSSYELSESELSFLRYLPNINEKLENGSVMLSTMIGYNFHIEIGTEKGEKAPSDINSLELQAVEERHSYYESLIDLNAKLGERKSTASSLQYIKTKKGEN